jgi:Fe-S-cluster containining protein
LIAVRGRLCGSGDFILNNREGHDNSCVFLDQATNLCTIYETRPDVCRAFDCELDERGIGFREHLAELAQVETARLRLPPWVALNFRG